MREAFAASVGCTGPGSDCTGRSQREIIVPDAERSDAAALRQTAGPGKRRLRHIVNLPIDRYSRQIRCAVILQTHIH